MGKTVVVTGATGYIGTAVTKQLVDRGDTVIALVRSDASAAKAEALGATVLRGELTDADTLTRAGQGADAAIHLAATNDEHGAAADIAAARALLAGLSGKTYIHTGGCWVLGNTAGVADETKPFDPPPITGWRIANEEEVLATKDSGGHPVVIMPGAVYGGGGGILPLIQVQDDAVAYFDDGAGHWSVVHVEDIADLYVRALDGAAPGSVYLGVSDVITWKACAEAQAQAPANPSAVTSIPFAQVQAKFGMLADAMALDQQLSGAKARAELGWEPRYPDAAAKLAAGD